MDLEKYPVIADNSHNTYEFLSEGPKGTIKKVVLYQKLKEVEENLFNLAFGDWNEEELRIDDKVKSGNSDRDKILRTVALTALDFIKYNPKAKILVRGSTVARTRLYQMAILANLTGITQLFDLEGFYNGLWMPVVQGKNYLAFTLKAK